MTHNLLKVLIIMVFCWVSAPAQTVETEVPVKWERYRIQEHNISVLLPKMPNKYESLNICFQEAETRYALYAENVIYGLTINSKLNEPVPDFCPEKRKFDETSFEKRLDRYKSGAQGFRETKQIIQNKPAMLIQTDERAVWFVNDPENNRWFEFWVINADPETETVKKYINSLGMGGSGIEIGEGSSITLGDLENEPVGQTPSTSGGVLSSLRLFIKPAPRYTGEARKNNVEGEVLLRMTFLKNGGIGSISATKTLPDGLTEEAIAAAKKIVFLPAHRNGQRYSVTKTVSYRFSLY